MSKWIYTDVRGCIFGVNNNDMTGNTGWQRANNVALTVNDQLTDEHGAALYKMVDGYAVERSEDERRADWPEPEPPKPSEQEQIDMLTECILEMSEIIYGE